MKTIKWTKLGDVAEMRSFENQNVSMVSLDSCVDVIWRRDLRIVAQFVDLFFRFSFKDIVPLSFVPLLIFVFVISLPWAINLPLLNHYT